MMPARGVAVARHLVTRVLRQCAPRPPMPGVQGVPAACATGRVVNIS
jgi:hypothetical protein